MSFEYKELSPCTTRLKKPFTLSIVYKDLTKKTYRKKFAQYMDACNALRKTRLTESVHFGADVSDDSGKVVAERDLA